MPAREVTSRRERLGFKGGHQLGKVLGGVQLGTAEVDAPGLGSGDALLLALPYILTLGLGHEGQHLQDQVGNEGADEVLAVAGVQQGHVQNADVNADLLGEDTPLLLDLLVISSQPVNAQDVEGVAGLELSDHLLIGGPGEILAGLLVDVKLLFGEPYLLHGKQLPVLVLVGAGHANVSIDVVLHVGTSVFI